MAAIARACSTAQIAAEIVVVISDRRDARGLTRARELGLPALAVAAADFRTAAGFDRVAFETTLRQAIDASGAQLVVLAGFMRILSPAFAKAMPAGCSTSTRPCCRSIPASIPMPVSWPQAMRNTVPACITSPASWMRVRWCSRDGFPYAPETRQKPFQRGFMPWSTPSILR